MKRKSLLFLLLFALLVPWAANAQTTVTIGEGTATSNTNPIGTYYNYSITEQLYTAEEIGMAGTISSISFYYMGIAAKDIPLAVYMANVDAEDLSTGISLADAEMVFSGTLPVTTTAGWVTINLDTPFAYDGTSSLLIGCIKDYLYYFSGQSWQGTATTTTMARYTQSDSAGPYTTSTVPSSIQANRPNIQMEITAGSGPVCEKPETFEVSNVTANSATLTWTGGSGTYNVEYKGGTIADWTSYLTNTTATTANLTGLTPGTAYQYRVQSVCGDQTSGWKSLSFSTMFGIPLVEPFGAAIPTGWSLYTGLLANGTATLEAATYGWSFGTGNNVFDNHARVNIYGNYQRWLVMPAVMMENNVQLTFDLALTVYTSGSNASPTAGGQPDDKFIVLISTDNMATWNVLRQWDNAGSEYVYDNITNNAAGEAVAIDLSSYAGQNVIVAFYGESTETNGDNNLHIDNVSIDYIPDCAKPTGLAASDVTAHTATISWTSDAAAWQVQLGEETPIDVTEPTYTFTGLAAETTFTAKVRANCGGTYSEWTNPVSFTTTVACTAPTALTVTLTPGDGTVAALAWTENGTATEWEVEYSIDAAFEDFRVVNVANTPSTTLEGLTPEITYYARVKTNCGGEDGYSTYSNTVSFVPTDALSITVNDGTNTNGFVPVYGLWVDSYTKTQFIIPAADLTAMTGKLIQKMTFYASNANVSWTGAQFEVYVAEVDYTAFDAATLVDWATMTKVRNAGSLAIVNNQMVVELTTPYQYMGGNLMIGILETTSGSYSSCNWYGVTQETNTAIGGYESSKALSLQQFLPKTTFEYDEMPNCYASGLTIVPAAQSADLTWTSENDNFDIWYREMVYEPSNDFENSAMQGWTNIDADGDGYVWVLGSEIGGVYLVAGSSLAGSGNNSSNDMICSGSYSNVTGALTPDNYLVSPKINLGGSITFWACAQDASYPEEHFGVAVSTTNNTDPSAFTTIQEWTMTAKGTGAKAKPGTTRSGNRAQGTWYEYTVDLSAYTGEGYVAIRHFDCTDQFILLVDDIVVNQPSATPIPDWTEATSTTNSYTITGLNPETEYEVQVRANCGGGEYSEWMHDTFWTTALCEAPTSPSVEVGIDYITLSWVSEAQAFDIALDGEIIVEGYDGYTYTFDNLEPGTEYQVAVRTNCREDGTSSWIGGYVTTKCEAFDLPYEYGFETADDLSCWSVMAANSVNILGRINITDQEIEGLAAYEGDWGFVFSSYNQADSYAQVLMSPELNSGDAQVAFEFYYRVYGSGTEEVYVLYSLTTDDLDEFEMIDAIEATNTDEWLQYQTTLPAGTKYVALYYASNYQYYLFVDGFKFEEAVGVTQTIELSAGWNLISTYLAIEDPVEMLDMLKASIGENATEIQSEDNMTEFDGSEWFGDLDDIGLENE
ncbi:MAG: choice-of-anchor J domain-containing protein, partial [Bacteroidales bacterium]|nr:choice-of-anchor J domain-containing protein [Bacteroidales bacterium]